MLFGFGGLLLSIGALLDERGFDRRYWNDRYFSFSEFFKAFHS